MARATRGYLPETLDATTHSPPPTSPGVGFGIPAVLVLGAVLAVAAACYRPALSGAFVSDDTAYLLLNPFLRGGLTPSAVGAALRSSWAGNWHPVTWLSHGADLEVFGLDPAGHHAVNVALHLANAALLCLLFQRLTGARWRSLLVGALFALHPIHVESVAWVAERKNVLSLFFGLLALIFWVGFVRRGTIRRYSLSLAAFALGLMAKPMLVTLPAVLLLLDGWPLRRPGRSVAALVIEKVPFLLLAAASSAITLFVQQGVIEEFSGVPFPARVANAVLSYGRYLAKAVLPTGLCTLYPHRGDAVPWAATGAAAAALIALAVAAYRTRRSRPWVAVGYLWFLGTLVPTIGLVQVGSQALADRYAYLPLVGVFALLAFAPGELSVGGKRVAAALAAVLLMALGAITFQQAGFWRDELTLYGRALAVTRDNAPAEFAYGLALGDAGRRREAIAHLRRAVDIRPDFDAARILLGRQLGREGRLAEAASCLRRIASRESATAQSLNNAGFVLHEIGRPLEAIPLYERAIAKAPRMVEAHLNLGIARTTVRDFLGAVEAFRRASALAPSAPAENGLGYAFEELMRWDEALLHYRRSLGFDPAPGNVARDGIARILGRR